MLSSVHIQWTLLSKTRSDATSPFVKDIVGEWWSTQTRPESLNHEEVVRKWVAPKTYIQHNARYLMEVFSGGCPFL